MAVLAQSLCRGVWYEHMLQACTQALKPLTILQPHVWIKARSEAATIQQCTSKASEEGVHGNTPQYLFSPQESDADCEAGVCSLRSVVIGPSMWRWVS